MWQRIIFMLTIAVSSESILLTTGSAQTLPGPPQAQAQPPLISPIQTFSAPTSGIPANILTPSTTNQLQSSSGLRLRSSNIFISAGRRLPGMPGGPPLNSPMGAQDPTADYMTPPVVGPLFCDPAVNLPC
jgi:hypothetical protein